MNVELLLKVADRLDSKGTSMTSMAANAIDIAVKEAMASSADTYEASLVNLVKFATWFDLDGNTGVADMLDGLLKRAAEYAIPKQLPSAKDLYDYKQHKNDSLFTALFEEKIKISEPELETWKGGGHPLLTRYSPDYPGVMLYRVSDGVYQDVLSKKIYDFRNGFVSDKGTRYYGGSVAYQTPTAGNYMRAPQITESRHLKIRPS